MYCIFISKIKGRPKVLTFILREYDTVARADN
jgi:hypothetical protein